MRVIGGRLGGRIFQSPHGHRTHPMSDKIRGALFNMLGDIRGEYVLDAFAGTGALSFEAIRRGAARVIAIDRDRKSQRTIKENIAALQVEDRVKLVRANARSWLSTTSDDFDLILLDPPYDKVQVDLLNELSKRLRPNGTLVLSWPGGEELPEFDSIRLQRSKQYGDASLHVYSR